MTPLSWMISPENKSIISSSARLLCAYFSSSELQTETTRIEESNRARERASSSRPGVPEEEEEARRGVELEITESSRRFLRGEGELEVMEGVEVSLNGER